jgi:hypothetical protein
VTVFDATRGLCNVVLSALLHPVWSCCAEGGVLEFSGNNRHLQALETVKLIVGQGESPIGRLVCSMHQLVPQLNSLYPPCMAASTP